MPGRLSSEQGTDQRLEALELRFVTQRLCHFAGLISKLVQATLASDG
jgi:hypothetical protein